MATIREILYQHTKLVSTRAIAQSFGISRTTIAKYLKMAKKYGYNEKISDDELQEISILVETALYKGTDNEQSPVMAELFKHKDLIKEWLGSSNITHTQIHRLLTEKGVIVGERSINRFIGIHLSIAE